jgi:hypothetical protein
LLRAALLMSGINLPVLSATRYSTHPEYSNAAIPESTPSKTFRITTPVYGGSL